MQSKIIPIKKDWRNSLIKFIQWLMAVVFLFVFFSCGDKNKYESNSPVGTKTLTNALCIKEARSLPNTFVYCDSATNTIHILKGFENLTRVYDSLKQIGKHGSGDVLQPDINYYTIGSDAVTTTGTLLIDSTYLITKDSISIGPSFKTFIK